jgi:hypothetical protein
MTQPAQPKAIISHKVSFPSNHKFQYRSRFERKFEPKVHSRYAMSFRVSEMRFVSKVINYDNVIAVFAVLLDAIFVLVVRVSNCAVYI